ncbi:MAG: 50S ribosomal protein L18 [Planctomycetota bacterium]
MNASKQKTVRRSRRKTGIRKRIFGTPEQPRLSIFRSGKHIYAQVIDDHAGSTLASASSVKSKLAKGGNLDAAKQVGSDVASQAKAAGVESVAFDRNGFRYHGRVKALADAAREGGLKF